MASPESQRPRTAGSRRTVVRGVRGVRGLLGRGVQPYAEVHGWRGARHGRGNPPRPPAKEAFDPVAALNVRDLGDFIRDQRHSAQISLRQLAKQAGVSNPYLSQIERGLRRPSAEILQQIAKALRISAEVLYVQAGILEERQGEENVMAAVLADESLSERQKQVVLDIYEAFCRENAIAARAGRGHPDGDAEAGPRGFVPGEPAAPTAGPAAIGDSASARGPAATAGATFAEPTTKRRSARQASATSRGGTTTAARSASSDGTGKPSPGTAPGRTRRSKATGGEPAAATRTESGPITGAPPASLPTPAAPAAPAPQPTTDNPVDQT
ncbi:transcriptional regulator, XRE family [Frankia casuarinae]|uniref:Transcriptional regulator, XRE family n=1 Tax=Frankia casuarinae (strain DSM 45818 / CECT 9043 / HFP020203 / CcI3) TaxID=106370 RepID=Q2JFU6_FRACC|nr:transcriptional regulator, XRE family [Frankia casuarinae]